MKVNVAKDQIRIIEETKQDKGLESMTKALYAALHELDQYRANDPHRDAQSLRNTAVCAACGLF